MNEEAIFASILSVAEDTSDPRLMRLTFVFTDFSPNGNGFAVPLDEAENIINSSIGMPLLINFKEDGPNGHTGAKPVGHITNTYLQDNKIIGEALLWKKEAPQVAEWIGTAHASDSGVQFSWELYYDKLKSFIENGITYLKGTLVKGITIVDNPAYEGRTPLLSFAEEDRVTQLESLVRSLSDKMDRYFRSEEAMPELDNQAAASTVAEEAVVEEQELETTEIDPVSQELEELRRFKATVEAERQKETRLSTRKQELANVGISDDAWFSTRAEFIVGLDDTLFAEYVNDLAHFAKKPAVVTSERQTSESHGVVPDPQTSTRSATSPADPATLGKALKRARKN